MRRWTLFVLLLSSCGKEPEAPPSSSTPEPVAEAAAPETPETPQRPSGPRPSTPEPPLAPRLSLTANGSDVPEVPKGTPILLELWLAAPPDRSLTIQAASGSWSSFLQLQAASPEWSFRPALQVGPIIKLDAANAAIFVWTLPAAAVDALPRGEHSIGVKLDARKGAAPDSWSGLVQPPPIRVRLTSDEAPSPSRVPLLVRCALWERKNDDALKLVEKELAEQPDSSLHLALKAEVLEAAGKPAEALKVLDQAIAVATRLGSSPKPYLDLRTALRKRLPK